MSHLLKAAKRGSERGITLSGCSAAEPGAGPSSFSISAKALSWTALKARALPKQPCATETGESARMELLRQLSSQEGCHGKYKKDLQGSHGCFPGLVLDTSQTAWHVTLLKPVFSTYCSFLFSLHSMQKEMTERICHWSLLADELSWLTQSPVGQDTLWWETSSLGLALGIPAPMNTAEEPLQARAES